jgi:predicted Zn-dependent protease
MDASFLSKAALANVGWAVLALCVLFAIAVLSAWSAQTEAPPSTSFDAHIRLLTNEATGWSAASAQSRKDADALRAVVQAAHSVAYLKVARLLAPPGDIERVANVRIEELERALAVEQQRALVAAASACADLGTPGIAALNTGWLP